MYRSLTDPDLVITLDQLRDLYPEISIGGDLRNSTLEFFEIPFRNIDLDILKDERLEEVDIAFNNRVRGAFTTSQGYLMQFDTSDSLKLQGAITLMEAVGAPTGYITQANDETIYNVPIATMKEVLVEMLSAYAKCHAHKQELRSLINNAQSKEELDEIVISWPI